MGLTGINSNDYVFPMSKVIYITFLLLYLPTSAIIITISVLNSQLKKKRKKDRERNEREDQWKLLHYIIEQITTAFHQHLQQQNNAGFFFIDIEINKHGTNKHLFSTFAHNNKQFKVPPPPFILFL